MLGISSPGDGKDREGINVDKIVWFIHKDFSQGITREIFGYVFILRFPLCNKVLLELKTTKRDMEYTDKLFNGGIIRGE